MVGRKEFMGTAALQEDENRAELTMLLLMDILHIQCFVRCMRSQLMEVVLQSGCYLCQCFFLLGTHAHECTLLLSTQDLCMQRICCSIVLNGQPCPSLHRPWQLLMTSHKAHLLDRPVKNVRQAVADWPMLHGRLRGCMHGWRSRCPREHHLAGLLPDAGR